MSLPVKSTPAQQQNSPQVGGQDSSTGQTRLAQDIPAWRRWLVVLGAFLALFCTFGQLSSFGTYLSWHRRNQLSSYSPAAISLIGSLQLWVFLFSVSALITHDTTKDLNTLDKGGVVGWYFDRYGPRPILTAGATIFVSSVMMISFCQTYYHYLMAQGVLFGLGSGLMSVSLIQPDVHSAYR